jgi:hypothetical protein
MRNKIMLLLAQSDTQPPGTLEPPLASEGQRVRKFLPKGAFHRRAFHLPDDPTQQIAHATEMGEAPGSFDAVFEVGAEGATWTELIPAVQGLVERLKELVNPARSAVIAGTEHVIVPGEQPLLLVFALRRLPSLTSEEFHNYWLNKHADVGRAVPGLQGYRQFHADQKATETAAEAAGVAITDFEGAAEGYYQDLNSFLEIMSKPEVTADAIEDEKKFIYHSRSVIGLFRVAWNAPV